ncbi:MAG: hypothetical protein K2X77_33700 [Candidatus Obscuribacterales bacterium]|nr:hypothetical protein [Candidatus Obscuribacterales bacterium]
MKSQIETVVLFNCGGKLLATLFASRREAFTCTRMDDQLGMIAVRVMTTDKFDESKDYLVRQVTKNGGTFDELVFGTKPKWMKGGTLLAERHILDSGENAHRLIGKFPAQNWTDSETRRHNGLPNTQPNSRRVDDELNDNCNGK